MTTLNAQTLDLVPVDVAAQMLGIRVPQIKQLQNDNYLLVAKINTGEKTRTGAKSGLISGVPRKMLQSLTEDRAIAVVKPDRPANRVDSSEERLQATHGPLWNLRGTLTLLRDAGLTDNEILAWLWEENEALGESPIDALIAGRHHRVNNEASALGF